MHTAIKLLSPYRGRNVGDLIPVGDGGLTQGAADVLVNVRRLAEWATGGERGVPFGSSPPVVPPPLVTAMPTVGQSEHLPAKADVLPTPMAGRPPQLGKRK